MKIIIKRVLLSLISFVYTIMYVLALDTGIWIFPLLFFLSENGTASGNAADWLMSLLIIALHFGVILLVIFNFKRIKGYFAYVYISSLLGSFFAPIFFDSFTSGGFIRFPWYFGGVMLTIMNLIAGPSLVCIICYFIVRRRV